MFFLSLNGAKRKTKVKILLILSAFLLTAVLAVVLSLLSMGEGGKESDYIFDLKETGGIVGFLNQFGLETDREENLRELTLPQGDDEIFAEYARFQSEMGLDVLKFSGKKVEERYLKLKNKTEKGQKLYAVIYIYKEQIVAAHLTTLEQNTEILPIEAFV